MGVFLGSLTRIEEAFWWKGGDDFAGVYFRGLAIGFNSTCCFDEAIGRLCWMMVVVLNGNRG